MKNILKLISLFSPKEKRRLIPLTAGVLIMSFLEIGGIGSIGPFMAVVSDPGVIHTNSILSTLYSFGRFSNDRAFLIALGIGIFLFMLLSTAFKMIVLYAIYRFVGNRRYTLGHRLFRQYLYQPYSFFLDHNTSELSKNLLTEVDEVVNGVLRPAMDAFSKGVLAVAILIFLILANPLVAAAAAGIFGLLYFAIYGFVRPRLVRHGQDVREANLLRYKATGEAFGAIKDVKILGKEPAFSLAYATGARRYAVTQAAKQILGSVAGQIMYPLATGFAMTMVIIMLSTTGSIAEILPLLTIYALAVQRLIPEFKDIFQCASQMRYNSYMVDALYRDMTQIPPSHMPEKDSYSGTVEKLPFEQHIELKNISFSYAASQAPVLKGIDLIIDKNTTLGLVGTTGCGKTTLVDVIMRLLDPTGGEIMIDGSRLEQIERWHRNFGYVPQQIYLSDDSVAANIAFGVPEHLRDMAAVEKAARVANLHDFIVSEMPQGYATETGERGIRLSGGQRQRVGIARALYHDPSILVMDEATSALDSVTEEAVMDAIHNLMHTKTIIIIAHRMTTVKECDKICFMEKGKIMAQGSYDDLIRECPKFRALAKVTRHG